MNDTRDPHHRHIPRLDAAAPTEFTACTVGNVDIRPEGEPILEKARNTLAKVRQALPSSSEDQKSWTRRLNANVWTTFGTWMVFHFGFGLLLRVFPLNQAGDYIGFWGWFLLVSMAGAGYGYVRAAQDAAYGIASRPISRAEKVLAGVLAVSATVIVFATDNTSARMPGRYIVALLVATLIVVDSVARRWRRGVERRSMTDVDAAARGRGPGASES